MNHSFNNWNYKIDDKNIVWLCIDKNNSNANVLSADVLQELQAILKEIDNSKPTGLVIYSGKQTGFIMGADINEFIGISDPDKAYEIIRQGQKLMDKLESTAYPTVCVINGFALGGGLELAMACRYRLCLKNDRSIIGLPEVQLGLHPGFGGTIRAVKIAGVRSAMNLMLTGKPITTKKALKQGFINKICNQNEWRDAAKELIQFKPNAFKIPFLDQIMNIIPLRFIVANMLRKQVGKKANPKHYPAPYAMIDLWLKYGAKSEAAYQAEARSMANLMCSETAKNLIRVFFLQQKLKSQGKRDKKAINHVHVIGAGIMGGDIAAWCALRGLDVTLQDRTKNDIDSALKRASKLFQKRIRNPEDRKSATSRLKSDINGKGIALADFIIEAIFEDLDEKKKLYQTIQRNMKEDAILATNTSSIKLENLRVDLKKPTHFIGLHFFNPVSQLPLVEIIKCMDTDDETIHSAFSFVTKIKKLPLCCLSSPGFVVNRILSPYMTEAMILHKENVALKSIDNAAVNFGMPVGPVELVDNVGLDIAHSVSGILGEAFNKEESFSLEPMIKNKKLGRKTGEGFYKWEKNRPIKPKPTADQQKNIPEDITDRLILPMVNEAIACLYEKIVDDSNLLDAGVIFGTGFAPFRGGPIQYARNRGINTTIEALESLEKKYGPRFKPHKGWDNFK